MIPEEPLIQRIHKSGYALVLCATGGGSFALSRLLMVPGASRSVLEATVPYAPAALTAWLGTQPEQFCSPATARLMAMAALSRAREFASETPLDRLVGLGCTASLASDRPKRGAHRVHIAWQSSAATVTHSVELEKGFRTRSGEELLVSDLILDAVAEATKISNHVPRELHYNECRVDVRTVAPPGWRELVFHSGPPVALGPAQASAPVLFPGAFHPLHAGHRGMAEVAARKLGRAVNFELSVKNVDKPPLDYTEIEERLAQFRADEGVWLTAAPTFVEKASLFPGATFVVGLDTVVRIGEARYYGGSEPARDEAIENLTALNCRFLVFGRRREDRFETLADVSLPAPLRMLCEEVLEQEFREDISSTELRRASD
jgi:nicotinamide mononucleotide (NMN) deamidase PncC